MAARMNFGLTEMQAAQDFCVSRYGETGTLTEVVESWDRHTIRCFFSSGHRHEIGLRELTDFRDNGNRVPNQAPTKTEFVGYILILAGTREQAIEYAGIMGFPDTRWINVTRPYTLLEYKDCSLYIVGTADQRDDYSTYEKHFHRHSVVDTNE